MNPLEPDLLGEHLVASQLNEELLNRALDWPANCSGTRALTVLGRLSARSPKVADLVAAALTADGRLQNMLDRAERQESEAGFAAAGLYADAVASLIDALASRSLPAAQLLQPQLGPACTRLAATLDMAQTLQYRRLADANPAAYLPNLAASLNNLSVRLGELGRRSEALTAIEEAVSAYRRLVDANPAAYLPDLAMSLNNLSVGLGELGRRYEALTVMTSRVGAAADRGRRRRSRHL